MMPLITDLSIKAAYLCHRAALEGNTAANMLCRSIAGTTGKAAVPPGRDEMAKEPGPPGGVGRPCKGASSSDGVEASGAVDPPGNGGEECKGVDPSSCGGDESEDVGPSDVDWRRSFNRSAIFLPTTGTATSPCALRISRTTGAASTILKMERIRRI